MTTTKDAGTESQRYISEVAAALTAAGFRNVQQADDPYHFIQVDLDGPSVDLIYDASGWKAVTYPRPGEDPDEALMRTLSDQAHAHPSAVVRLARPVLAEAVRRWGPPQIWTFFGHWDNGQAVVEYVVPGDVQDIRRDTGVWPEGLWAVAASGRTAEEAKAAALAAHDPDNVADLVAHDAAAGLPGWQRVEESQPGTLPWAEGVLMRAPHTVQVAVGDAAHVLTVSLARSVLACEPTPTAEHVLAGVLGEVLDVVHGTGTARLVSALLTWWQGLPEEQQAMTGIAVPPQGEPSVDAISTRSKAGDGEVEPGAASASELRAALTTMAAELSASEMAFEHLTCSETDSVVRVLAVGGFSDAAAGLIIGHAGGDSDDTDLHTEVFELIHAEQGAGSRAQWDAAQAYVKRLLTAVDDNAVAEPCLSSSRGDSA